jgi:carboxyl-terminal processing protease
MIERNNLMDAARINLNTRTWSLFGGKRGSLARLPATALLLILSACGGGGDDDGGGGVGGGGGGGGLIPPGGVVGGNGTWQPGIYQPSSVYAARCVAPRSGTNPETGQPYPDLTGTVVDQNNWLRSWTRELYLWYSEVPDLNPASYATPAYFDLMKTSAKTSTNADKDRFHFTYSTPEWLALSGAGQQVGYGLQWALVPGPQDSTRVIIAYVEPDVPAATLAAALSRGVEVISVDGVTLATAQTQADVDKVNAGLFPDDAGENHTFGVRELNGTNRNVMLQTAVVTSDPVPVVDVLTTLAGDQVGYLLFNDHMRR